MCPRGKWIANLSTSMRKHSHSSDISFYMKADAEPNKNHPDGERSLPSTKISALLLACTVLLVAGKALVTLISQPASLQLGVLQGWPEGILVILQRSCLLKRAYVHLLTIWLCTFFVGGSLTLYREGQVLINLILGAGGGMTFSKVILLG